MKLLFSTEREAHDELLTISAAKNMLRLLRTHDRDIMRGTEGRKQIFLNKKEEKEKCSEMKRKRDVRVTSCSCWAAGVCPWTLYLDSRDADARSKQTRLRQKSKTGLEAVDDTPTEALEIPFPSAFAAAKTELKLKTDH